MRRTHLLLASQVLDWFTNFIMVPSIGVNRNWSSQISEVDNTSDNWVNNHLVYLRPHLSTWQELTRDYVILVSFL